MNLERVSSWVRRFVCLPLIFSLLAPSLAFAKAKPLTPQMVHDEIVKRGTGCWVDIQESNGLTFHGHVTDIGDDSFGIQLPNQPAVVTIRYADVTFLNKVASPKAALIVIGAVVAVFTVVALVLYHEFNVHKNQMPPEPTLP